MRAGSGPRQQSLEQAMIELRDDPDAILRVAARVEVLWRPPSGSSPAPA